VKLSGEALASGIFALFASHGQNGVQKIERATKI
jgi:hypothetical protein